MFKGRQFDRSVILHCIRWYLAYSLSPRDLKEMMGERRISSRSRKYSSVGCSLHPLHSDFDWLSRPALHINRRLRPEG